MELILAVVVVSAVIFFGALISAGNERQRKAIDALREQATLWAVQDLRIKRSTLEREVRVDDPLGWFGKKASKIVGSDLELQVVDTFDDPPVLVCDGTNGFGKLLFTPVHPSEIRRMSRVKPSKISQFAKRNPLLSLPARTRVHELSVLNSGILFDLELSLAWNGLATKRIEPTDCLWMYEIA